MAVFASRLTRTVLSSARLASGLAPSRCVRVRSVVCVLSRHASLSTSASEAVTVQSPFGAVGSGASPTNIRNLAIIAHVDHGKTTLVDKLLECCGHVTEGSRVMDSLALEQERGVTIKSKVTAVEYKNTRINIVDTPGHADFGGEVERVMGMVDGVLLLVDAVEGPMTQTKFVLSKALSAGLTAVVVINKVDRDGARVAEVESEVLDLFMTLEASDEQLEFATVYASAKQGWSSLEAGSRGDSMAPLLDTIVARVPPPRVLGGDDAPFAMVVAMLSYDKFVGRLLTGRVTAGRTKVGDRLHVLRPANAADDGGVVAESSDAEVVVARVTKIRAANGTSSRDIDVAVAGDIIQLAGFADATVSDTVCDVCIAKALPSIPVEPPTIAMTFSANDSPLQGKEGSRLTSQMIADRLMKETLNDVSIRVRPSEEGGSERMDVLGRGEMQLGVLIETMRREGFELSVSPPRVVPIEVDGKRLEPFEEAVIEVNAEHQGKVIEAMSARSGELLDMVTMHDGRVRLSYTVPSRGLIGYAAVLKLATGATGAIHTAFLGYRKATAGVTQTRKGVLISSAEGTTTAYALNLCEERGALFVGPGVNVYAGMIVGEHSRGEDIVVNPCKAKQVTNIRAAGSDEKIQLTPPRAMPLEAAIGYVLSDELIEVTPTAVRLRKRYLNEKDRKRHKQSATV